MIFGMSFYQICWFFLIYSFIGWVIEVAFHAVTLGKVVNRGFLNGPLCPVYGFGMLIVLAIYYFLPVNEDTLQVSSWLVFLAGMFFTTLVELIAGWILDKAFHARWWDYSDMPLNLHGYICLAFSIIWGLAVMFAIKFAHPLIAKFSLAAIPQKYGSWLLVLLYAVLFADIAVTVAIVRGLNKDLKRLDEWQATLRITSDAMSQTIAKGTLKVAASVENAQVQAALGKAELQETLDEKKRLVEQKYAEIAAKKGWVTRRLLRAFPNIKHNLYSDSLQRLKTQLKKYKK